jgi:predicted DNA-binding protein
MCPVDFAPSPLKPQAYGTDFLCRQASSQTKETLMPEAKAYVTFRMLHTTHRRLKQLTDLTGRPMTDLLDEAVANALREAQERRTCGCIRSAR